MGPLTSAGRLSLDPVDLVARFMSRRIIRFISTISGLWTAFTPLLLWIHWPMAIWQGLFWSGMIAMLLTGIFTAALMPPAQTLPGRDRHSGTERTPRGQSEPRD
ncbi:MAG: hypothetical protein ACK5JT_22930 [Hyphomicrobiaceae bacterium]